MSNEKSQLTPKRSSRGDDTDAWYPYYAGFSQRFAAAALDGLGLAHGAVVLDPWVGSGTTLAASAELGFDAIGIDLNPFAVLLSSAKLVSKPDVSMLLETVADLAAIPEDVCRPKVASNDPILEWLTPASASEFRRLLSLVIGIYEVASIDLLYRSPAASFLAVCLLQAARQYALDKSGNPTWFRPGRRRVQRATIRASFVEIAALLTRGIMLAQPSNAVARVGDARSLGIADASIGAILTSPPYCTRIDYAVTTKFELAALGLASSDAFPELRRKMMGTTMLRAEANSAPNAGLPSEVDALLEAIRTHDSYRSEQYYFPNFSQYFSDAMTSMKEMARVLLPGSSALVVLQTSYYKDVFIDLPELYRAMGREVGLTGEIVESIPVKRVMTTKHKGSQRYRGQRVYSESIVKLSKAS